MLGSLEKLSPELRNRIYELVLVPAGEVRITTTYPRLGRLKQSRHHALERPLALIMTCRQAYNEAMKMFFALNTFRCFFNDGSPTDVLDASSVALDFVKSLGSEAATSLRNIILSNIVGVDNREVLCSVLGDLRRMAAGYHQLVPLCIVTAEIPVPLRSVYQVYHIFHIELKHGRLSFDRIFKEIDELSFRLAEDHCVFYLARFRKDLAELCSKGDAYTAHGDRPVG